MISFEYWKFFASLTRIFINVPTNNSFLLLSYKFPAVVLTLPGSKNGLLHVTRFPFCIRHWRIQLFLEYTHGSQPFQSITDVVEITKQRLSVSKIIFWKTVSVCSIPLCCYWDITQLAFLTYILYLSNGNTVNVMKIPNFHGLFTCLTSQWNLNRERPLPQYFSIVIFTNCFSVVILLACSLILQSSFTHHPYL